MQRITKYFTQFALYLLCLALFACSDGTDEQFSSALAARYDGLHQQDAVIPVAQLTNFGWDQVFLFGPYSSSNDITRITGVAIDKSASNALEERDDIHLLVFLQQKKLAKIITVKRNRMDFAAYKKDIPLTPAQALLVKAQGQLKTVQWQ